MLALFNNYASIDGIEPKSGYPHPVSAVFLCVSTLHARLWRDDRPQYNTLTGNKARVSFWTRLSPAALIKDSINQTKKTEGIPMPDSQNAQDAAYRVHCILSYMQDHTFIPDDVCQADASTYGGFLILQHAIDLLTPIHGCEVES